MPEDTFATPPCARDPDAGHAGLRFSFAFQPIFDIKAGTPFAYEALVRGAYGEPAISVLSKVDPVDRSAFDQALRIRAVELAASLMPGEAGPALAINFMPDAVKDPVRGLRSTLETARHMNFGHKRLLLEASGYDRVAEPARFAHTMSHYAAVGFTTAIDDFGVGDANLATLVDVAPHMLKLDRHLVRDIDTDHRRRAIVASIARMARELDIELVGQGVDSVPVFKALAGFGVRLFQGDLFAKPAFEALPSINAKALTAVRDHEAQQACAKIIPLRRINGTHTPNSAA
ncbi:EAL domain-containing protein [Acuticoccus sp. MNP-M23]|uniref:EAL domain-containing protein n=1 Tax=Acuticoccus sp. MNP-M23 TaxID=3072793 RepID=UPI002815D650|nr:EAL domain-containing protein [Acuticoccus sp. MNP-M23]WMS41663.1 EAL domain-containing protein [Acuticoccus sp. MNP-M23]